MASIIRIKRSEVTGNPATLGAGELAYSALTGTQANGGDRLYIGMGSETNGDATNHYVVGGKYFTDKLDHVEGTLTANSAIIVDTNSKIDNLKVDNIDINGNTISTTDTNGNLILSPNGTGTINVDTSKIVNVTDPTANQDAATKAYVDTNIAGNNNITIVGDSGTGFSVSLADSDLNILGTAGLFTHQIDNGLDKSLHVGISNTGVTAGTYGSAVSIPIISVNGRGQITTMDSAAVATTVSIAGDSSTTDTVDLINDTLTFTGTGSVKALVTDNQVAISVAAATTTSNGLAAFDANDFEVDASGNVDLKDTVLKTITTDDGAVTVTSHGVSIFGGEGVDVNHSGTAITVKGEDATASNKGIASFSSDTFTVASGAVDIGAGQIDNSQLATSTVTIGTTEIALGAVDSDLVGLNSIIAGEIKISGNTIQNLDATKSLYIDPAPAGDSAGGNAGELVIRGDLVVQGTTTTINSTTMSVNDLNLILADSAANAAAADGAGITVNGPSTPATLTYNGSSDRWDFNKNVNLPGADLTTLFFNGVDATEVLEDHLGSIFSGSSGTGQVITYDDTANTFVWSNDIATLTNVGVANFGGYADADSAGGTGSVRQFEMSGSNVWIAQIDGGTY